MKRSISFIWVIALIVNLALQSCTPSIDTSKVAYNNPPSGVFLTNWLVLGPISVSELEYPTEEEQLKSFDIEHFTIENGIPASINKSIKINGEKYTWEYHESPSDIVDFSAVFGNNDYVSAYAYASLEYNEAKKLLVGIGSDDAIQVWLNGKEVHKNYVGRAVIKDQDLVELNLMKGINHLLVKVQDMSGDWGFCIRPIGTDDVSQILFDAAGRGNIDKIKLLLKYQPNVNYKSPEGLTTIQNAMLNGRVEVIEQLESLGAVKSSEFPDTKDYIHSKIEKSITGETPAFAVLVSKNGEIIFENAYGYANMEDKTKATTTTKFRIGSITKQFIATAILKLQEEGKLKVDDKLSDFIPDYPRGEEVTIHHLLTHTSGIHSYTSRHNFIENVTEPVEAKTLIDSMKTWDFDFNPGDEFRYNNSGYFLLAEIIEIVSGQWYGDYLQDKFFAPLGMNNTGVYQNGTPPTNEAIGYTILDDEDKSALDWDLSKADGNTHKPSLDWDMSWAGGAGSLYSTVEDLYIWNEAIFNGKVLNTKSIKQAHSTVILNDGSTPGMMKYGYGWVINDMRGAEEIAHGGGLHGFISYLSRYPADNISIITLTNTLPTMEQLDPNQVANEIAEYLLWEKLSPQESYSSDFTLDTNIINDYVGRYDYGNSMILVVTTENNQLFAQMSGQPKFELFPSEEDEFFWKAVEAKIKFVRDETGIITHGIHTQGGNDLEVPKIPDLETIAIVAEDIAPYLGSYKLQEGFFLEISLVNDNQLFIQATGQDRFEIFRVSEDTYQPKTINLSARFYMLNGIATMDYTQGTFNKTLSKE